MKPVSAEGFFRWMFRIVAAGVILTGLAYVLNLTGVFNRPEGLRRVFPTLATLTLSAVNVLVFGGLLFVEGWLPRPPLSWKGKRAMVWVERLILRSLAIAGGCLVMSGVIIGSVFLLNALLDWTLYGYFPSDALRAFRRGCLILGLFLVPAIAYYFVMIAPQLKRSRSAAGAGMQQQSGHDEAGTSG